MQTAVRAAILLSIVVAVVYVGADAASEPYDRHVVDVLRDTDGELVDARAPEFALPDRAGVVHRLSDYRGQAVFVNFWASWCAPCREEFPAMIELARSLQGRPFVMVAVSLDEDEAAMTSFLTRMGVGDEMLILRDPEGQVSRQWGTLLLPESYVVDPDGTIVARYPNVRTWTDDAYRRLLERVMVRGWRIAR